MLYNCLQEGPWYYLVEVLGRNMSWIKDLLIVITFSQIEMGKCLKMYNSTLTRDDTHKISGLQLLENQIRNVNWSSGITICTRFNYKKILDSILFTFGQNSGVSSTLGYPTSRLYFPSSIPWPSFQVEKSVYLSNNKWNHWCLAIDGKTKDNYIYMVGN